MALEPYLRAQARLHPSLFPVDVAKACKALGIKSVAVTAGYITPEPRKEFFAHMDAANVDLKAFTDEFYHSLCGGHLQHILDTLLYIKHETDVWLELTTLLIPGKNDSDENLRNIADFIAKLDKHPLACIKIPSNVQDARCWHHSRKNIIKSSRDWKKSRPKIHICRKYPGK